MNQKWEGNVRQLQNVIHSAVIFTQGKIRVTDLAGEALVEELPNPLTKFESMTTGSLNIDHVIRNTVIAALRRNNWCKLSAAQEMGVGRQTFYNYLHKYQMDEFIALSKAENKKTAIVPEPVATPVAEPVSEPVTV
jgi:transcriptional regulator of acetoin/glycerol metabolism